jgi:hypothetical protein
MSLDLYGTSSNAIAQGNMRTQQVRDLNERIQAHNTDVANTISGLKDQEKTTDRITQGIQTAQGLWTSKGMPDKVKAYNDWSAGRSATNPTTQSQRTTTQAAEQADPARGDARAEAPATSSANEETAAVSGADGEAGEVGAQSSKLTEGLEETVGEDSKFAGKFGEGAGVLMSAGTAGMDLYQDYEDSKKDGHFEIAGNNAYEKAGNILQIGGGIADVVGVGFPPAKLLGGVLDLAATATNEIGESLDTTDTDKLSTEQTQETEQTIAAPAAETITTGRVQ